MAYRMTWRQEDELPDDMEAEEDDLPDDVEAEGDDLPDDMEAEEDDLPDDGLKEMTYRMTWTPRMHGGGENPR